jgi:hypothetical protein
MRALLVHVCLPIACGAAIYVGWRSPHLMVQGWLRELGLGGAAATVRAHARCVRLPGFVKFSMPDALWCYALVAHFGRLWKGTRGGLAWAAAAVIAALSSELGQLVGVVPGTFDPADLASVACACALALLFLFPPWRIRKWTVPAAS